MHTQLPHPTTGAPATTRKNGEPPLFGGKRHKMGKKPESQEDGSLSGSVDACPPETVPQATDFSQKQGDSPFQRRPDASRLYSPVSQSGKSLR
jgi:hypothetical protein